jgi:hypothetical protein
METELVWADPRWPGVWAQTRDYIAAALERGENKDWGLEDLRGAAISGHLTLWGFVTDGKITGAGMTTVTHYPKRRVLEIVAMGADKQSEDYWLPLLERLKAAARSMGCSAVVGTGRPGWARKLGAKERRVFEVELSEE